MTLLLHRMYEAAEDLSREEFVALSSLQPLYTVEFLSLYMGAAEDLRGARELLIRELRRSERLKPQLHEVARTYWNTLWAIGHLGVLVAMNGGGPFEHIPGLMSQFEEASISSTR